MIRTATSPRLAISTRLNINLPWLRRPTRSRVRRYSRIYTESGRSELIAKEASRLHLKWNIAVLARRILFTLVLERLQRAYQLGTRIARHDHFIYIAQLGGLERIRKRLPIVLDQLRAFLNLQLVSVQNIDRLLGTHHCDLRARIGEVEVTANMF